ncbi:Streptogramin A acetyltransferase [compost metagenome]
MKKIRNLLWRILGFDYNYLLEKTDFVTLKRDLFTEKGKGTYDNGAKVWRWSKAKLVIGKYCSIAHNVNFIVDEGFHGMSEITNYPFINNLSENSDSISIRQQKIQKEGITVGNDVWVGINTVILPGIKIGNGVTIAAGSVVTKDIPDYVMVAGMPAKIIKEKYSTEQKSALNKIAWWNWEEKTIDEKKLDFYKLNVEEFIDKYKR